MNDYLEHDDQQTVPTANHTRMNPRYAAPQQTVQHRAVNPSPPTEVRRQQPVMPQQQIQARPPVAPRIPAARPVMPQTTLPNPALRALPPRPADAKPRRKGTPYWVIGAAAVGVSTVLAAIIFLLIGMSAIGSDRILSGVSVAGVSVGGLSVEDAAAKLTGRFPALKLVDGSTNRDWLIEPQRIGLTIDAAASAQRAYNYGRKSGNFVSGLLGAGVSPVLAFDREAALAGLQSLSGEIAQPAVDAGIALENGRVRATPARDGRTVDLNGTVDVIASDPVGWLTHGEIPLKMVALSPAITDAGPMVAAAEQLLASPLVVEVFDPASGAIAEWSAASASWAGWLRAEADPASPNGLRLSLDESAARAFVSQGEAQLTGTQYIKADELVTKLQDAVRTMNSRVTARIYHHDRQRVVQAGETIISIAYDEGVPYPWVQHANGGIQHVSVGQTITIPSPDNFFQFEPVKNKRIIVSISEQRVRVIENGQIKWDWAASTGINSSPTWPGIYQIISHYPNAYAGNWNLYMPQFMGVYQPIPGSDFTNGFHGFPTRGGGQILWENSIGTKVTYGCILLNNTNAKLLYDWAEEGVVVEITG